MCARTHILETAHTHKFAVHRHIAVDHKITIIKQTINFSGTKNAPFLGEDLFFGLHLISDTKTALILLGEFPEKVRTSQSFCSQRPQEIRGNIAGGACTIFGGHTNSRVKTIKKKIFIAKFHEIWGEDQKKRSSSQNMQKKKRFLSTNTELMTSILGFRGPELHSSGTEPVTFFGLNPRLGGRIFPLWRHKQ